MNVSPVTGGWTDYGWLEIFLRGKKKKKKKKNHPTLIQNVSVCVFQVSLYNKKINQYNVTDFRILANSVLVKSFK